MSTRPTAKMHGIRHRLTILLGGVTIVAAVANAQTPHGSAQVGNSETTATTTVFDRWHKEGLSYIKFPSRTPGGLLYGHPVSWEPGPGTTDDGWQISRFGEIGIAVTSGGTDAAAFREYSDRRQGLLVRQAGVSARHAATGRFINLLLGSPGLDDQYLQATAGQYGSFRVTGYFQSLRHQFASNAKPLWTGVGTDLLRLPPGVLPGSGDRDAVIEALIRIPETRLSLKRDKGGIVAALHLSKRLELKATVQHEWRKGSRPFATAFTFPTFGQTLETVEPIDYQTTDFSMTLDYTSNAAQVRLRYQGSLFRNANAALTVENPGLSPFLPSYTADKARIALPPDNHYHIVSADLSAPLSFWHGRLTAAATYSLSRQNDPLLPPTVSGGVLPLPGGLLDLDQWNTSSALSQQTADARKDRLTATAKLLLVPGRKWRVSLAINAENEGNDTRYTALNPITGQYGYVALDGGLGGTMPRLSGIYDPTFPGSRIRFRNMPFTKDKITIKGHASYRFSHKTKLTLDATYREETRRPREVETTRDSTLGLAFVTRALRWATLRMSYSYTDRAGSPYIPNPYEAYYTSSLPGYVPLFEEGDTPHTLANFRKFDLAAHHRHALKAQLNIILAPTIDLAVSSTLRRQNYRADYGLQDSDSTKVNAELTWQPDPRSSFYAFASYDTASRNVASIRDVGQVSTDGTAGGANYPLTNAWTSLAGEKGWSLGSGFNRQYENWTLDLTYMVARNRSKFDYAYASTAAYDARVSSGEAGTGLPDQTFLMHRVTANLGRDLSANARLSFRYRMEHEALDDYHYNGLDVPLVGNNIYLGIQPEDFTAHSFGAFLAVRF